VSFVTEKSLLNAVDAASSSNHNWIADCDAASIAGTTLHFNASAMVTNHVAAFSCFSFSQTKEFARL
jgi:hypothetical protein